ncbi:MAG: hypothetical protein IIV16_02635 [Alistipes sp.]|nr:hypothetical protein [Alistipes sp.]
MKKTLIIYAVVATLLLIISVIIIRRTTDEIARLNNNCEALNSEVKLYSTRLDESAASVVALQLELDEYREQHKQDLKRIRALGVRPRRVESVAKSATKSEVQFVTPCYDTVIVYDTIKLFRWSDKWTQAEGTIRNGEVECKIESIDTIRQVVHRVPRRFGLIRYGTKAIRQEITSSNPHTKIVYTEYIELPKRRKKR